MRGLKLAAAAAAALVTAACGSGGGDAGSDESDSAKSITVWMMGSGTPEQTTFLDGVEAEFQKEHAGVEVDVQYIPWPDAAKKFQTALAGGEGPDVTEVGNTDTQTWIGQDAFLDLSADLESWDEGKDIVPSLLANDQSDGKT